MISVEEKVSGCGAVCEDWTGGPCRNCAVHQLQMSFPCPGGVQQMSHFTSVTCLNHEDFLANPDYFCDEEYVYPAL